MKAGEAIAKEFYFVFKIKLFWGKSGLPNGQACWVIPSAGDREESATETHRRWPVRRHRQGCKGAVRAHQQHW